MMWIENAILVLIALVIVLLIVVVKLLFRVDNLNIEVNTLRTYANVAQTKSDSAKADVQHLFNHVCSVINMARQIMYYNEELMKKQGKTNYPSPTGEQQKHHG